MRYLSFLLVLIIFFSNCKNNNTSTETNIVASDTIANSGVIAKNPSQDSISAPATGAKLALTSNAIQLINVATGSTREIGFGMPDEELLPIINRILGAEPGNKAINNECGAGPLKMISWANGLTLVFQEKEKGNGDWIFAGWSAAKLNNTSAKVTTIAGIGPGSSLQELQDVYVATVNTTSLGQEFSVKDDFYGLLSGKGKDATIEVMWSGASCNFR